MEQRIVDGAKGCCCNAGRNPFPNSIHSRGKLKDWSKASSEGRHPDFLFSFPSSLPPGPKGLEPSPDNGLICHALELQSVDQLAPPLALAHLGDQGFQCLPHAEVRELVRGKAGNQSESMLITPPAILGAWPRLHGAVLPRHRTPAPPRVQMQRVRRAREPPSVLDRDASACQASDRWCKSATSPQLPCR